MKNLFVASLLIFAASLIAFAQTANRDQYSIQQYLNIRSASSPSFSPNGKTVAYLTNVTGTSQVWTIPAAGGEPKQLTDYGDNIGFARFSPTDNTIVFGKASGGDENTQLFVMQADGSAVRQLTSNPKVRHNFGDWSSDGKQIFYASNKRSPQFFDIYAMNVADASETMILQHDGSNSVAAVSKDGKRIIVSRSGTELSLDNDLYLVDVTTKQTTHLTPHTGAAQFGDVHFLRNGDSVISATNNGRDFYNLARMNLGNKRTAFLSDAKQDLDATALSDNGKMFAYTSNRDGYGDLYIAPTADLSKKAVNIQLPGKGVAGGLEFSKDNSQLAFTFSGARHNPDVYVYNLRSKQILQLTRSDRANLSQDSFVEPELIKFKSFDEREIPAWFYKPSPRLVGQNENGAKAYLQQTKSLPVIVSVHGGPEGQERPGFNALYQYYLSRGYAVLATNVRGSTGYGKTFASLDDVRKREDSVKDLAAAAEWLKSTGGADPKRIAVTGGSYGGYMTMAAITLYPDLFAAAVNTVGIVNWETFLKNTSGYRRRQREVEYGRLDRDLEFLRAISPLGKVDRIKTPLMVIHGKNDPRVPYTEAEQIVEALKKRGAAVEYKLFDDEGHGISKLKNRLVLYPLVADFLDRNMRAK